MSPSPRRSGRPTGAPPNRAAILAAARGLFAERGYERTTVRAIAAAAGVDPALVHHYFGSKDQLLRAALTVGTMDLLPQLTSAGLDGLGERMLRSIFAAYDPAPGEDVATLVGLVRSATTTPDATRLLRESFEVGGIVQMVTALHLSQPQLRAALLGSELFGLVLARYVVGLEPIASAEVESLVAWYGPTLQRYLVEPLPQQGPR